MIVVELVAAPAEELDGRAREGVGELEDLLDVGLGDPDAGVGERSVDGVGLRGGDDFAEELDFWREVWGVEIRGESWVLFGLWLLLLLVW